MRRIQASGRSISRFGLCLAFAWMCGFAQPGRAQPIAVGTLTLPQGASDIVWDGTRSRFFVSSGTNVLMINPETAQIEDTISVDGQASHIAVSDDGQYLYAALGGGLNSLGTINRYRIQNRSLDVQIALGKNNGGNFPRGVQAILVLPGQPSSILVALTDNRLIAFDGAVARAGTAALNVTSLYVRPSDGAVFGVGDDMRYPEVPPQIFWFVVGGTGVTVARSVPVDFNWDNDTTVTWNGNLVASRNTFYSYVFDLSAGATIGRLPVSQSTFDGACFLATDASGTSAITYQYKYQFQASITRLVQYSLPNLAPTASGDLTGISQYDVGNEGLCGSALTWGTDGILIRGYGNELFFLHASGLTPLAPAPIPAPTQDASGAIHLALPANGLVYDAGRNLLWASVPGSAAFAANSVVSIDPGTGNVIDAIFAGSEPGALALSSDGSHLFAGLGGAPAIASIDLSAKRSSSFSVLDASNSPYWSAIGLAAIAGHGNSVVAVRSGALYSSVIAYDAGVARENVLNSGTGSNEYAQYVQTIFPADAANAFYAADTYLSYGDGRHDVSRLIVDSTGVHLDAQLNSLLLGSGAAAGGATAYNQPVSLVTDSGRLYTSAGQIFTPDTKRILGSVTLAPAYGLPIPFSDRNGVVYVQSYSPQVSAIFYDFGTLRPLMSVPLITGPPCACGISPASAVNVVAAVRAGNNAVAIAANGEIVIAPLASFQPWPSSIGAVQSVSPGVRQIDMPVNAISVLPGTAKLLLAAPSRAGSMGNSVVTFNPDTNRIESAAYIGSEPSILAAAPDGSAVYAYLSGEYNVARLNVTGGSRDLVFTADPTGGSDQQYGVFDMAVSPDGGLAVSSLNAFVGIQGRFDLIHPGEFIGIFDNGVPRPQIDSNSQGPWAYDPATFSLAFDESGSRLYAYNSFLSSFELKSEAVSAQGVQWLSSTGGLIGGYGAKIGYAHGLLYGSRGEVVDPETLVAVGQFADAWFASGAAVAPDPAGGRVYFATQSGILVFDINTRALLARLPINHSDDPQTLVRLGADGLAVLTRSGQVYLVSISAIALLPTPVPPQ